MKKFRLLKPDEIECRVSQVSDRGATLLLYKTARTDADLLDETVGADGWQNDFKLVDGVLYGGIGIIFNGAWVWKWDAGTESNTEAEKGRASDAFKRAGFKWGIGRELYSAPFTFVPANKCNITERNGRKTCYDKFDVAEIDYTNDKISRLVIALKGLPVFTWGAPSSPPSLVCDQCGSPIYDGRKRSGEVWPASDIAAYTKLKFGRCLCAKCAKEQK